MTTESLSLSKLSPPKGARKSRTRLGRGEASGHGKTCGRGGKGQKGRKGAKIRSGFEGGQMPLYRRIPKLGFFSRKKVTGMNVFDVVSLTVLNQFENGAVVDIAALANAGLVNPRAQVKILGSGELTKKLTVKVSAFSVTARAAIEKLGGKAELVIPAPEVEAK